jgi:hypothetical protein
MASCMKISPNLLWGTEKIHINPRCIWHVAVGTLTRSSRVKQRSGTVCLLWTTQYSLGSSVSIVTKLLAGLLGFDCRRGHGYLFFATASRPDREPTQASYSKCMESSFPVVKRPERGLVADLHLALRLRMIGAIPRLPSVCVAWRLVKHRIPLHGVVLFKYRDNFTFYVYPTKH